MVALLRVITTNRISVSDQLSLLNRPSLLEVLLGFSPKLRVYDLLLSTASALHAQTRPPPVDNFGE